MQLPFEDILKVVVAEVYAKRNVLFLLSAIISLSSLTVGVYWPKHYTASTIIHVDNSNILQPLMEGAAETTRVDDLSSNAREIIFGEKIMAQILEVAGWLESNPSNIEQERIKKSIRENVKIKAIGENLLKIEYRSDDAERAYITAKEMAEMFIREGEKSKIAESNSAYEFIDKQVNEYLEKLTNAEEELREFRSNNPESRRGLEGEVSGRISRLHSSIEQAKLELRETLIRRDSLKKQLSGEAAITISQSREGQYRAKIASMQTQLETLRLDFKETYPDIVRLKHQIEDLKHSMSREIEKREEAQKRANHKGSVYIDEAIILNPLYQQLRSDMSAAETQIATLKARISELNSMLKTEFERANKIHAGEAMLSKLTRDYTVNQEIYQDLLRRRENARVSRSLDEEQQGLTFKIQEPAKIPLLPTGIRFLHFAVLGIVGGVFAPLGLIYFLVILDPRIRFSRVISEKLQLPVIAELPVYMSESEIRKEKINNILLIIGGLMLVVVYGYVAWLKRTGQI